MLINMNYSLNVIHMSKCDFYFTDNYVKMLFYYSFFWELVV